MESQNTQVADGSHQSRLESILLTELLSYEPADLDPELRSKVASILHARSELLARQAQVAGLRAQVWSGVDGLTDIIDLKAAELAKLRKANSEKARDLLKDAVDLEGLLEILPAIGVSVLEKFNIPLPVVLEVIGVDIDAIKEAVSATQELIKEL